MGFFVNWQLFGVKKASEDTGHCLASTLQAAVLHPWPEREQTEELEASL